MLALNCISCFKYFPNPSTASAKWSHMGKEFIRSEKKQNTKMESTLTHKIVEG